MKDTIVTEKDNRIVKKTKIKKRRVKMSITGVVRRRVARETVSKKLVLTWT